MYGEVFGYVPEEALGEWKKRLEFGSKKDGNCRRKKYMACRKKYKALLEFNL